MAYSVVITTHVVSYYAESAADTDCNCEEPGSECFWLNGGSREITPAETEVEDFPCCDDPWDTPHGWAVQLIRGTDVTEASSYPLGDAVAAHGYLFGQYTDPYTGNVTETTVRLTGEWTDEERADVFRAVTRSD